MPYATPTLYLQRFGLEEAVQLLADEEQLLTAVLLKDAIAVAGGGAWTGTPTAEEMAAGQAALARLVRALEVQSNFMDGYLRSAITLPLPPEDANMGTLEDCCLTLVRCSLADDPDNATESMGKACATWREWLNDVARKRVQLVATDGNTPATAGRARSGQAVSNYPWGSYGGVR